jgi:hypothetical protein
MTVDHTDAEQHGRHLWLVYGHKSFPTLIACKLDFKTHPYTAIWGFSVYRRKPGFRTIGRNVDAWIEEGCTKYGYTLFEFYDDQEKALDRLRELTCTRKVNDLD